MEGVQELIGAWVSPSTAVEGGVEPAKTSCAHDHISRTPPHSRSYTRSQEPRASKVGSGLEARTQWGVPSWRHSGAMTAENFWSAVVRASILAIERSERMYVFVPEVKQVARLVPT